MGQKQHVNVDSNVTFELGGKEQFTQDLSKVEDDYIRDFEKIVKRNSARLVKESKRRAPEDVNRTENFQKSLRNRIRSKDVSRQIGLRHKLAKTVASRSPHRHLVGEGTGQRKTRSGANRGAMPANDYMEQSIDTVEPKYVSELRARITRKVEI